MQQFRAASLVMLAVAVFALLGHVCTPWAEQAVSVIAHADGHGHDLPHGDGHSGDALHAASCEALRPPATQAPAPLRCAAAEPAVGLPSHGHDAAPRSMAVISHAPPIYLLHAALLI